MEIGSYTNIQNTYIYKIYNKVLKKRYNKSFQEYIPRTLQIIKKTNMNIPIRLIITRYSKKDIIKVFKNIF